MKLKNHHCFLVVTCFLLVLAACSKENPSQLQPEVEPWPLTFEVEDVELDPDSGIVKVSDSVTGTVHKFQWEQGDCIRLFAFKTPVSAGEKHISDLGVFSASRSGATTTFSGYVSSIDSQVDKLFAVYPAKDSFTYDSESYTYNNTYYYRFWNSMDQVQTGNAMKHCIFTSNTGTIDPRQGVTKAPAFKLSHPIIRFQVNSTKDISNISITSNDVKFIGNKLQMRTTMMGLNSGWDQARIELRNGAVIAPKNQSTSLTVAFSQITKAAKFTFTFTATDGSVCSKVWNCTKATAANNIYYIGEVMLDQWESGELPAEGESAAQCVKNMGLGTNLCCTFECGIVPEGKIATRDDPVSWETMTARSVTTQKTMTALAAAGFKTIRIPVTWYPHMDNTMATIDKVWLDRIAEVIGYAFNAGMYVIINVHSDAGNNVNTWLLADYYNYNSIRDSFVNIWSQIAQYFRDYDYRLIFEGYNEIVEADRTWFIPKDYNSFKAANMLNQTFVNTVRATRGHNAYRNLCVNTFSAGTLDGTLSGFEVPSDEVQNHIMVQVHSYLPDDFCTANLSKAVYEFDESSIKDIDAMFKRVKYWLLDKGYPVIMGEYGSFPTKYRSDVHRGRHAAVYTRKCLDYGIAPLYWYNPMDYQQRSEGIWTYPILKDSLCTAYKNHLKLK